MPGWPVVHEAWRRAASDADAIAPCGTWAPEDRWQLVPDNAEAFALRDRLYASARHTIDLATFYLQADATGWRTARALADCARRGVRVRVVADGWATRGKAAQDAQVHAMLRMLEAAGVQCRLFADPRRPFDACHRKLLLVDGRQLLLGGRNHADHYAGSDWRDVELLVSGPTAATAQPFFDEAFDGEAGRHAGRPGAVVQPTTPAGIEDNAFFVHLLRCVRAARRSVDIENAYYFHHPVLHAELADARARGVRVRVLTNSTESNDLQFMNHRLQAGFGPLLDAGIELHLQQGKGRTLHGKYFVADGEWVGFGTSNLDYYSPRFCLELGLHLRDGALGRALTAYFEQGIASARRATAASPAGGTVARLFDRWFTDIQ